MVDNFHRKASKFIKNKPTYLISCLLLVSSYFSISDNLTFCSFLGENVRKNGMAEDNGQRDVERMS
jgi:hypothetical protein